MSTPFMLIAKAGGSDENAENTCEAFAAVVGLAKAPGTELALEVDVRLTSDRKLVALHDATLDRTTDWRGPVRGFTLERLRTVLAGAHGERIPTLDEVLEVRGELELVVEAHESDSETAGALVAWLRGTSARVRDALIVASEHDALVHCVRSANVRVRTAATSREALGKVLLERVRLDRFASTGHPWLVPERHRGLAVVTERFIRTARRRGEPVLVFTVNEAAQVERLRRAGLNGVFTTRPRALTAALTAVSAP